MANVVEVIAADVVLTAAHCLYNRKKNRWAHEDEIYVFKAIFTDPTWFRSKERGVCQQYFTHDLYDPIRYRGVGPYDIAVIKLQRNFNSLRFEISVLELCHFLDDYKEKYNYGVVMGLGLQQRRPRVYPDVLLEATLIGQSYCARFFYEGLESRKPNWKIQACYGISGPPGQATICYGDSGDPLVYKSKGEAVCLIGVASYTANPCDDPGYPAVFTLAGAFRTWIYNQLEKIYSDSKQVCNPTSN